MEVWLAVAVGEMLTGTGWQPNQLTYEWERDEQGGSVKVGLQSYLWSKFNHKSNQQCNEFTLVVDDGGVRCYVVTQSGAKHQSQTACEQK